MRKNQPRIGANLSPSGFQNRICLSSLSQSSFAVLLAPHRERSGKSCRRPSASGERNLQIIVLGRWGRNYFWEPLGADRICPNVPDEGRAVGSSGLATKSTTLAEQIFDLRPGPTCESEDKKIRFASPEGRIQARVEDPKRRANL